MTLLIPEVHPANVLFYWLLSFVARVESLYFHPLCARLAATRIGQIGGAEVFSSEQGWVFRSRQVAAWEALAQRIPDSDWQTAYRGIALDFTKKAKQDLWRAFEDFELLKAIQQKRARRDVQLVRSDRMTYLANRTNAAELFRGTPIAGRVSSIHCWIDRMWEGAQHTAGMFRVAARLTRAIVGRLSPARVTLGRCSILYLCDNRNDLHESPDKRSVTWLTDGQRIREADVLLVLPDVHDQRLERFLAAVPGTTIQAGRAHDLYRRIPASQLVATLIAVIARLPAAVIAPLCASQRSMLQRYLLSSMEFDPIVRHVRPICCLETDSSMGVEKPALIYFTQLGMATVMCHFSTVLLFHMRPGGGAVRDLSFAHPLASHIVCWNEQARALVNAHAHEGSDVFVLGPLMPGRDAVLSEDRCSLRERTLPPNKPLSLAARKWISVFDVMPNPTRRARQPGIRAYAEPFTEHVWIGFMKDMLQLVDDDPRLVMVYKPKRVHVVGRLYPVSAWFPTRANEYLAVMDAIHTHERMVVLDEDINPWIPIALADLCISLPAGSPVCAGWHVGIPGIYHDPLGMLGPDDYRDVRDCLSSDYSTLRSKVHELLDRELSGQFADFRRSPGFSQYVGRTPGGNASVDFREFLSALKDGRRPSSATVGMVVPQTRGIH